jgi:hypothetical protein
MTVTNFAIESFRGVPVQIREGGHYPPLNDDPGKRIDRYIDVVVEHNQCVPGHNNYVSGDVWSVTAVLPGSDYEHCGHFASREAASAGIAAAWQIITDRGDDSARYAELVRRYGYYNNPPLSRADYEVLAHEIGFEPVPDSALPNEYFDPGFNPREAHPRLWTDMRRAAAVRAEQAAIEAKKPRQPARKPWPEGQLWDECDCGREPVYMPLHVCKRCWVAAGGDPDAVADMYLSK